MMCLINVASGYKYIAMYITWTLKWWQIDKFLTNICTLLVKSCDLRVKFVSDKKAIRAIACVEFFKW